MKIIHSKAVTKGTAFDSLVDSENLKTIFLCLATTRARAFCKLSELTILMRSVIYSILKMCCVHLISN